MKTIDMKPGFRKLIRTLREQSEKRKFSDTQIIEWADRHGVDGTLTDLRCMVEDAASMTPSRLDTVDKLEGMNAEGKR